MMYAYFVLLIINCILLIVGFYQTDEITREAFLVSTVLCPLVTSIIFFIMNQDYEELKRKVIFYKLGKHDKNGNLILNVEKKKVVKK